MERMFHCLVIHMVLYYGMLLPLSAVTITNCYCLDVRPTIPSVSPLPSGNHFLLQWTFLKGKIRIKKVKSKHLVMPESKENIKCYKIPRRIWSQADNVPTVHRAEQFTCNMDTTLMYWNILNIFNSMSSLF